MQRFILIGWLALLLAGCDDLPIYGGEHGGDDWAATSGHASHLLQSHGWAASGVRY
jgi:hypothetical protein